jgi:hypothetical protein
MFLPPEPEPEFPAAFHPTESDNKKTLTENPAEKTTEAKSLPDLATPAVSITKDLALATAKSLLEPSAPPIPENPIYKKIEQPTEGLKRFGSFAISPPSQPTSSSPQPSVPPLLESIAGEPPSLASFKKFSQAFSAEYARSCKVSASKEKKAVRPSCPYSHLTEDDLRKMDIATLILQLENLGVSESELTTELEKKYPILNFVCPLSTSLIKEPVLAGDGYNYERADLENYISFCDTKHQPLISPMTKLPMAKSTMPNDQLKRIIRDFLCSKILTKQAEIEVAEKTSFTAQTP